jgi:CheY-like chemotaxis protein
MEFNDFALCGMTVLVVDNEPEVLVVLNALLSQYHVQVIAVADGEEGLAQIQLNKPNVIICDINMSCMDGYEFIREVRNLPSYQGGQTPAIAFSRFNCMEDRTKAMAAGFQAYLSKPVELNTFLDTVASTAVQLWH